jgi:hypothetical protein
VSKIPPFKMLASRQASLKCDGKFVVAGRASFVWETFLMRRASGVPGDYEIRGPGPWHEVGLSIEQAEALLEAWGFLAHRRVARARRIREGRTKRGLPVA